MSSLDLTRDWLRNVLRPYAARDRIQQEVMDVLAKRRTLAVKTDAFTFDNGQTALLLLLHGTLPITFRGATYQIPIHLWFPHDYPRAAPLAFVVPTKDMGVRKGREVEPGGRVKEDVVEQWWTSWETKSIEVLLGHLTSIFSAVPPVYARPPEPSTNGASSSRQSSTQTTPARPTQYADMHGSPSSSRTEGPPPPPARPGYAPPAAIQENLPQYRPAPTPPPHPFPHQTVAQPRHPAQQPQRHASGSYPAQLPQSPQPPHIPGSPPIPARPGMIPPRPLSQGPASPQGPVIPHRPYASTGPPPPTSVPAQQPMTPPRIPQQPGPSNPQWQGATPPQFNHQPFSHPHQPSARSDGSWQAHAGQGAVHSGPSQVTHSLPPTQSAQPTATTSRQPAQDLLSSPEDATSSLPPVHDVPNAGPPPVPPSKPPPPSMLHLHSILLPHLNATLPPLLGSLHSSRQHLAERKEDLLSGEPAIRDEMARLEAVKKVCDSVGRKMDDVVARGEERVAELEGRGEVSVDELVCGISIVHNQLIDLVAEDNAIEDTIYHMTRALDSERIDLDRFLKSIRSLAREQYMKRALIERILQSMGQGQTW